MVELGIERMVEAGDFRGIIELCLARRRKV